MLKLKKNLIILQNNWLLFCLFLLSIIILSLFIFNEIKVKLAQADTTTPQVTVGNAAPTISSHSFNVGNDVTLIEETFKWASSTMTITDTNGCGTITSVTAKAYRSDVVTDGTSCSQDDQNCYIGNCVATTTGNTCSGDNDVEYDCGFKFWYIADPTDAGTYISDIWVVMATSTDGTDTGTATNTDQTVEIISLNAVTVTSSIDYSTLSAGQNTGTTNQSITATTTGNTAIDVEVQGARYMCSDWSTCAANTLDVYNQKYSLTDNTYSSLTYTLTSTTTPQLELTNIKPTSTTTPQIDISYWGIQIPTGSVADTYTSTTTLSAVSD